MGCSMTSSRLRLRVSGASRLSTFSDGWPSVEISDGEEIEVTAEVPGLEEKDVRSYSTMAC